MNPIYPHSQPKAPLQLYLLAGLAVFGLAALWLAAYHAFSQIAGPAQAFFAATLIEAGLIVEAVALIKRPRVWYIVAALAISLAVSGTYNYIQAAAVATGSGLNDWQLITLALGPLAALAFVSLTLGHELREHQHRLEAWHSERAAWLDERRCEAEAYERQKEAERQTWLHSLQQAEVERQQAAAERQWQAEQAEREWQRRRQERAERLAEQKERLVAEQAPAPPPAPPAPAVLKCVRCGATSGKSGTLFRSQAALNAHAPHCPGQSVAQRAIEPVPVSANGQELH